MIKYAFKGAEADGEPVEAPAVEQHIGQVPRISIQAFCEAADTAAAMQAASEDRRMVKAHVKIQMGGMAAAAEAYRSAPTPNVVIIESESRDDELLAGLDHLAEVCDAGRGAWNASRGHTHHTVTNGIASQYDAYQHNPPSGP